MTDELDHEAHDHGVTHGYDHGHEDPDPEIVISPIAKSVVALLVTTVVFAVLMIPLVRGFDELADSRVEETDRIEIARPSGPLLQPDPELEYQAFRQREDAVVGSYGWSSQSDGIARIPVERAKALILQEGVGAVGGGMASPSQEEEAP